MTYPPKAALKIVTTDAGFELLLKSGDAVRTIATVHRGDHDEAAAHCFASAFLMLHALEQLYEYEQPDNWDADDDLRANWGPVLLAILTARGHVVPPHLKDAVRE